MKQTVEEAAKEYADDNYPGSDLGIRIMAVNAFEAGAEWQAKQSPWINIEEGLPKKDGYYVITNGNIMALAYFLKCFNKFARYRGYPYTFYENSGIKAYFPIPNFKENVENS